MGVLDSEYTGKPDKASQSSNKAYAAAPSVGMSFPSVGSSSGGAQAFQTGPVPPASIPFTPTPSSGGMNLPTNAMSAGASMVNPNSLSENTVRVAGELGIDPIDLATAMHYETAGSFDPWQGGPTTKYGKMIGLIQMGKPQREATGYTKDSTIAAKMTAVGKYLKDAGVKPGMGLLDIYSAINAGRPGMYNASDVPGQTVRTHVATMMKTSRRAAADLILGPDKAMAYASTPDDPTNLVINKDGKAETGKVRVIQKGAKGAEVKPYQIMLASLISPVTGKPYYSGGADGDFGKMTQAAVKQFQKDNGLTPDGKIGVGSGAETGPKLATQLASKLQRPDTGVEGGVGVAATGDPRLRGVSPSLITEFAPQAEGGTAATNAVADLAPNGQEPLVTPAPQNALMALAPSDATDPMLDRGTELSRERDRFHAQWASTDVALAKRDADRLQAATDTAAATRGRELAMAPAVAAAAARAAGGRGDVANAGSSADERSVLGEILGIGSAKAAELSAEDKADPVLRDLLGGDEKPAGATAVPTETDPILRELHGAAGDAGVTTGNVDEASRLGAGELEKPGEKAARYLENLPGQMWEGTWRGGLHGAEIVVQSLAQAMSWTVKQSADYLANHGYIPKAAADYAAARHAELGTHISNTNKLWETQYGDLPMSDVGTLAGELAVSGPLFRLIPGGEALNAGARSANRLMRIGSRVAESSRIGGAGMALTASGSERPLDEQVITGMVAGPIVAGAAKGLLKAGGTVFAKVMGAEPLVRARDLDNLADRIDHAGMTEDEAIARLKAMGPNGSIRDLHPSMSDEAANLARRGGKGAVALSQSADRAVNQQASAGLEAIIGPRPDVDAESAAVQKGASANYEASKAAAIGAQGGEPIRSRGLAMEIKSAAGKETAQTQKMLGEFHDFLVNPHATAMNGGKTVYHTDLEQLITARKNMRNWIEVAKNQRNMPAETIAVAEKTRGKLTRLIHENSDAMRYADQSYRGEQGVREGMDIGMRAFAGGKSAVAPQELSRELAASSPDRAEGIRMAGRQAVWDVVQGSTGGELSAAAKAFGENSRATNRENLSILFGKQKGEQVANLIDDLQAQRVGDKGIKAAAHAAEQEKRASGYRGVWRHLGRDVVGGMVGSALVGGPHGFFGGMAATELGIRGVEFAGRKSEAKAAAALAKIYAAKGNDAINLLEAVKAHRAVRFRPPNKLFNLAPAAAPLQIRNWQGNPAPG